MKGLISSVMITGVIASAAVTTAVAADKQKVFFLLPNSTTIRFESRDAPFFKAAMAEKAPDAEVIIQNAQGDPARQQRLVEDAISQGAKVIVLASADATWRPAVWLLLTRPGFRYCSTITTLSAARPQPRSSSTPSPSARRKASARPT